LAGRVGDGGDVALAVVVEVTDELIGIANVEKAADATAKRFSRLT